MKTEVIFRKFKEGDIIAFFPGLVGSLNYSETCLSYQHIGQHGSAYARSDYSLPAKKEEYETLQKELEGIGYDLKIVKKFTKKHFEKRNLMCISA